MIVMNPDDPNLEDPDFEEWYPSPSEGDNNEQELQKAA